MALKNLPAHTQRRLQAVTPVQYGAFSGYGHDGGPMSPMNGRWVAVPRSADADTLRSLPRQRAESRELRATNPIATGAIGTNVTRVVGTGLQPVFTPDVDVLGWTDEQAAAWAATTAREFSLWADSTECDWEAQQTFFERQALVLDSRLTSGDCFTLLPDAGGTTPTQPYRLRLQLLEADRVGNPSGTQDTDTVVAGVRRPEGGGAPEAFHVYARHPGGLTAASAANRLSGDWVERIGASGRRRILHHFRPTRPEQTRGQPYLSPVIQTIRELGRFTEAEITAAVINSFFTTFIETPGAGGPAPVFGLAAGQGAGAAGDEIHLGAGAVIGLGPGEKAAFADPKRPNPNAEAFIMGMLKLIGMGLGLPFEVLVKQFNSSFSASKAALLDAWMHFRTERAWLVNSFCQPVVETWLAEAVAIGRISAPGFFADPLVRWAYTRCAWHGDSQGSINPKDEVEAYLRAIEGRLMTAERAEWELFGTNSELTYPKKLREHRRLVRDDMLPAPRAGAAAPAPAKATDPADPADQPAPRRALDALEQRLHALEHAPTPAPAPAAPAPAPVVHIHPAAVTVQAGDTHLHLPEGLVQLEATLDAPVVNVAAPEVTLQAGDVHVPPAQVVVQPAPAATRQVIERDDNGDISAVTTTSLPATH